MTHHNIDVVNLTELVDRHFNDEELRQLCFSLRVDHENFESRAKLGRIRELVQYMVRQGRVDELIEILENQRPNTDWSVIVINNTQGNNTEDIVEPGGCGGEIVVLNRRIRFWYNKLSTSEKVAIIGGLFALLVAVCNLSTPIISEWSKLIFIQPTATFTPTLTPTLTWTPTPSSTPTPTLTPTPSSTPTPTLTPTPTPTPPEDCPVDEVVFLRDDVVQLPQNSILRLKPGESVSLTARIDTLPGCNVSLKWVPNAGTFSLPETELISVNENGVGRLTGTYQAPGEPGAYSITVEITTKSQRTNIAILEPKSITVEVQE